MGLTAIIPLPFDPPRALHGGSALDATGSYTALSKLLMLPILISAVAILPVRTRAGR